MEKTIIDIKRNRLSVFPSGSGREHVAVRSCRIKSGTRMELHRDNVKTTPRAKVARHMGCQKGWVFFLANLKAWLEGEVVLRSHDHNKSYRGYCNS